MDRSLVHLPPTALEARRLAPALSAFPNLRGAAFPNPAYPREQVLVKPLIDGSLEGYEVCFAGPDGRWLQWRQATQPFHTSFPRLGESGQVWFRLRYKGMESAIQAVRVDVLPFDHIGVLLLYPGAGVMLDEWNEFAIPALDGADLVNHVEGLRYHVRTRDFESHNAPVLVSRDGKILTPICRASIDIDGKIILAWRILQHDIHTGMCLHHFDLDLGEEVQRISETGHLQTLIGPRDPRTPRVAQSFRTRFRDITGGGIVTEVKGHVLGSSAAGTIAVLESEHVRGVQLIFFRGALGAGPNSGGPLICSHQSPSFPNSRSRIPLSADGEYAGVFSLGGNPSCYVVRTSDCEHVENLLGRGWPAHLREPSAVWMEEVEGAGPDKTTWRLYDWATHKLTETLGPYKGSAHLLFSAACVMPDVIVEGPGNSIFGMASCSYRRASDNYGAAHRPNCGPYRPGNQEHFVVGGVTSLRHVWTWDRDRAKPTTNFYHLRMRDLATGTETTDFGALESHSDGTDYAVPTVRVCHHMVTLMKSARPLTVSGVDDRTGERWTFDAPARADDAEIVSTDGDKTVLWRCTRRYNSPKRTGWIDQENQYYVWDRATGHVLPVDYTRTALPVGRLELSDVCFVPKRGMWLLMRSYYQFEKDAAGQDKRSTLTAELHVIAPTGEIQPVLDRLWEIVEDDVPSGWRAHGQWGAVYRPLVALSHTNPGYLAFFDINRLGVINVLSREVVWTCPNPMHPDHSAPDSINYGPGDRIWASFGRPTGTVAIDQSGRIDPSAVLTAHIGWPGAWYELPGGWRALEAYVSRPNPPAKR